MKQKVTALKRIIGVNELIDFKKYNILFLLEFLTAGALWKRNNEDQHEKNGVRVAATT